MATKYFGDSYYAESLLVRCACKDHMVEFFQFDGLTKCEYGISCLTPLNRKFKGWAEFYFKDFSALQDFVMFLDEVRDGGSFAMDSYLDDSYDGILLVDNSCDGYVDIVRYMSEKDRKKNRCIWDICLLQKDFDALIKELRNFVDRCLAVEMHKNKNRGHLIG
jgi:hypothetical protein